MADFWRWHNVITSQPLLHTSTRSVDLPAFDTACSARQTEGINLQVGIWADTALSGVLSHTIDGGSVGNFGEERQNFLFPLSRADLVLFEARWTVVSDPIGGLTFTPAAGTWLSLDNYIEALFASVSVDWTATVNLEIRNKASGVSLSNRNYSMTLDHV